MNLVLDVQCFKRENNKFMAKELAAYDGEKISHFVFKPPFPFEMLSHDLQKQANWLTRNHHGIDWSSGSIPMHLFGDIMQDITTSADRIYVKGREKADYLRKFIPKPIIEFDEEPALSKGAPRCFYHSNNFCMCALTNVFYLHEHFIMS
jgi:hypothetical protein